MSPVPPFRILVVAEDGLARTGLRTVVERAGLTAAAGVRPEELDADLPHERADAAVWDLGASGDSLERLRGLAERLPVVAVLWSEDQAREALAAGARAVLLRDQLDGRLGSAVHAAATGLVAVDPSLAETVLRPPAASSPPLVEPLTPRESEVLQLVAEGLTNRRIAERLGISEHTAKFHVNAILGKLGAQTRGEAVAHAARLGLVML
jgi:DNA-binding NarL/FixJ family response regulator